MRWNKSNFRSGVLVLTASVIFVAIERDASLKVAAVKAPPETRNPGNACGAARPTFGASRSGGIRSSIAPGESRARQTRALSSRDQNAPAFFSRAEKARRCAPNTAGGHRCCGPDGAKSIKSEAPVPVGGAAGAPPPTPGRAAAIPAASSSCACRSAGANNRFAAPHPQPSHLQVWPKKGGRPCGQCARKPETGRAAVAEAKIEKLAVTGSRIEPDQHAPRSRSL